MSNETRPKIMKHIAGIRPFLVAGGAGIARGHPPGKLVRGGATETGAAGDP
jgi:hypothetical protein